jgi:type IV secretory pathway TrbD component
MQDAFRDISEKGLSQSVMDQSKVIAKGDLGTRMTRGAGNFMMGLGGTAPAVVGMTAQDWTAALIALGVVPTTGAALKGASRQGTSASIEALRRQTLGIPRFQGPITPDMKNKIRKGLGRGILGQFDEDETEKYGN